MKNVFKFMGVALMACSLIMVSCKKDENDDNNGGNTSNGSMTLKWDNTTPTLNFISAVTNGGIAMLEAAKGLNGENPIPPYFNVAFGNSTDGTAVLAEYIQIDDQGTTLDEYYPTLAYDENEDEYHFLRLNATPTWGAFDATNYTIDCDLDMGMYNYDEFVGMVMAILVEQGINPEEATQAQVAAAAQQITADDLTVKNLVLKLVKYQFTYKAPQQ